MRIKQLREAAKLSQRDLAEMLGVSNAAVSMWESGKNRISTGYLERLADIFGVTTDYILGREPA